MSSGESGAEAVVRDIAATIADESIRTRFLLNASQEIDQQREKS
jgi:hypothetical protein